MNDSVLYLKASLSDSFEIAAIEEECFSVPWSKKAVEGFIENPLCTMLVAKVEEKIIGYIGLYIIADDCDIANVAVTKSYRGQGIAISLINLATEYAKNKEVTKMMLEVRESNIPAIKLYEKLGFSTVGIRKNYYTQPKENALLMDKTITEQD